jgi:dTMP kinase
MTPLFIVIEGLDGSGGTTQSRLLHQWLESIGHQAHLTAEPSTGPIGKFIREVLLNSGVASKVGDNVLPYLFAADRRDHIDSEILPNLQKGSFVIGDRYYHSSLAYQALSVGLPLVAELNDPFRSPDITFFLYLSPEVSFDRVQRRGEPIERFETLDRLRAVADAYKTVLGHCRSRDELILTIDATRSIEEIHQDITDHVQEFMSQQ